MQELDNRPRLGDLQGVYQFLDTAHEAPRWERPKTIPRSLGDFERLFDDLRTKRSSPAARSSHTQRLSTDSSSSSLTLESSPPTSEPEPEPELNLDVIDIQEPSKASPKKGKEVRWEDGIIPIASEESPSRSQSLDASTTQERQILGVDKFFVSRPIPKKRYNDRASIQPIHTLTNREQKTKLIKKLVQKIGHEPGIRRDQGAITQLGNTSTDGIHVFIDLSNIMIGFYDKMKANRGIAKNQFMKAAPMSFHSLAIILERGQKVSRRVVVGSTATDHNQPMARPSHIADADALGYKLAILERVPKLKLKGGKPPLRKKGGSGSGYLTSGYSSASASESTKDVEVAMVEQGVNEILHIKIMESIIDYAIPSTIVLASGDGTKAEYSGGFFKNVV